MPSGNANAVVETKFHWFVCILSASIANLTFSVVSTGIDNAIHEEKSVVLSASDRHNVLALENCEFGRCANSVEVFERLQIES